MIDRYELIPHFEWLSGSEYFDEALGEAALAIELTALGCERELMRLGAAWMWASGVVEKFGLEAFVEQVRRQREAGDLPTGLRPQSIAADRR